MRHSHKPMNQYKQITMRFGDGYISATLTDFFLLLPLANTNALFKLFSPTRGNATCHVAVILAFLDGLQGPCLLLAFPVASSSRIYRIAGSYPLPPVVAILLQQGDLFSTIRFYGGKYRAAGETPAAPDGLYRSEGRWGFLLCRMARITRPAAHRVSSSAQGSGDMPSPVAGATGSPGTGV